MPRSRDIEEVYSRCQEEGKILPQENTDKEKIKSRLKIADEDLESAKQLLRKKKWNSSYKLYYDVLRELTETYLLLDN